MFRRKKEKDNKEKNKKDSVLLEDKINDFINWYKDNMVMGKYTSIGEYFEPKKMRYFIDDMTAWFERIYLEKKLYNNLIDSNNDFSDEFKAYFKSLSWEEKIYLCEYGYSDIVYIGVSKGFLHPHFHLNSKGIITICDDIESLNTKDVQLNENLFINKHIEDAYEILKGLNLKVDLSEIEFTIKNYKDHKYMREELLNCVMYNIIERGGNGIGPRRGLIFASEFKCDINIPMKYGVDLTDPYLREFMNAFFKLGGKKDLECINGYFFRDSDNYKFDMINMKELMLITKYSQEEKQLQQKFVNVIQNRVDSSNKVKKLVK